MAHWVICLCGYCLVTSRDCKSFLVFFLGGGGFGLVGLECFFLGGGEVMDSGSAATAAVATTAVGGGMMRTSPFTVSQWQELEHQALILKYLMAGLPVPPELVLPIQKSFESMSSRFFYHPTMSYCSFYGKKVDPEPGRCRRTDGKKWRCSKDAYPDSKYCERHMHRGRNRSRKPVESQTVSQSSSTVTSLNATGSSGGGTGNFQNLPMPAMGNLQGPYPGASNQTQMQMEPIPYGISTKDYRYLHGLKPDVGEHSFFSEASGSNRGLQMDSPVDSPWSLMPSRVSSFPQSKSSDSAILQNDYPQYSFFGSEYASAEPVKQEGQSLRPFFDEWPKTRDSWSGIEDERSNQTSFSTTQLSISIPKASSNLSATGSQSPHGEWTPNSRSTLFIPCILLFPTPSTLFLLIVLQIIERSCSSEKQFFDTTIRWSIPTKWKEEDN
ncbi:Glutamine-Leucine-Glutamine, QLQ [Dillenia turbinata]|uniref:Growth-regulating factor n=1 Tax=Dillenia turbinata TaxID=194707 RepID=A0AAN8ZG52_9MAGN